MQCKYFPQKKIIRCCAFEEYCNWSRECKQDIENKHHAFNLSLTVIGIGIFIIAILFLLSRF